jgi:hypothetical protein
MSIFSKELENFLQGRGVLEQAEMLAQENGTTGQKKATITKLIRLLAGVLDDWGEEHPAYFRGMETLEDLRKYRETLYVDDLWSAFEWVNSPQGHRFWYNLEKEFEKIRKDPPQQDNSVPEIQNP